MSELGLSLQMRITVRLRERIKYDSKQSILDIF